MNFLLRCTFVTACVWLMLSASALVGSDQCGNDSEYQDLSEARCDTDTDCMRLCPPDDEECDGGPQ